MSGKERAKLEELAPVYDILEKAFPDGSSLKLSTLWALEHAEAKIIYNHGDALIDSRELGVAEAYQDGYDEGFFDGINHTREEL